MSVTLCKAMYFSAVMKVLSSRGSCTSRSHPHFSHASGIHWTGSEVVVMAASSQPAAAYPFGRTGQMGREATAEELARELGITPEKVLEIQRYAREPCPRCSHPPGPSRLERLHPSCMRN
jgi:hypothetical protein